jgi:flagella basal body P-ring formation protein FlgA
MILSTALLAITSVTAGCAFIDRDKITGADLARALPLFAGIEPNRVVSLSPAPGHRRVFSPFELQRILEREQLAGSADHEVCFEWTTAPLAADLTLRAMKESLGSARLEIVDLSKVPAPSGTLVFPLTQLQKSETNPLLWRGFVEYAGNRKFPVWARVNVFVSEPIVVAAEDLKAKEAIQANQVRIQQYDGPPLFSPTVSDVNEVIGLVSRGYVKSGGRIRRDALDSPNEVVKGDLVTVEARVGAARVSMQARASSSGRRGDMIQLRNESSGKAFSGVVDGVGKAVIGTGANR